MKGFLRKDTFMQLLVWSFILLTAACVPEKGQEKAGCGPNQAFNEVSRQCYSTQVPREVPVAKTTVAVPILEDSGQNLVTVAYTDVNADFATSCTVKSYNLNIDGDAFNPPSCACIAGVCQVTVVPDSNWNGIADLKYTVEDQDGESAQQFLKITVTAVDDPPVTAGSNPFNGSVISEDLIQTFVLNYTDPENDTGTICEVSDLSPNINAIPAPFPHTGTCYCEFGVCRIKIQGDANYHGNNEFFSFKIQANSAWSNQAVVVFDIAPVNDAPVLPSNQTLVIIEDVSASYDLPTMTAGTDVDVADLLAYNLVDFLAAGMGTFDVGAAQPGINNGCFGNGGGGSPQDLDCEYIPPDADYNSTYEFASGEINGLRFVADTQGVAGKLVSIEYIDDVTADMDAASVVVVGNDIDVTLHAGVTTSLTVKAAIEALPAAAALVDVFVTSSVLEAAPVAQFNLGDGGGGGAHALTGVDNHVFYTYDISDGTITLQKTQVDVDITPSNDNPILAAAAQAVGPLVANGCNPEKLAAANDCDEDTTFSFLVTAATDQDYKDTITYTPVDFPDNGTLKNCMGLNGSDASDLLCEYTPNPNYSGADTFTYKANDGTVDAAGIPVVTLNIQNVDDNPIICNYTKFEDAPECGGAGCIGIIDPTNFLVPTSHQDTPVVKPIYYFDIINHVCYESTNNLSSGWQIDANGYIADVSMNQAQSLRIPNIRIGEGGPGEIADTFTIMADSSDPNVLKISNILFCYDNNCDDLTDVIAPLGIPDKYTSADPDEDGVADLFDCGGGPCDGPGNEDALADLNIILTHTTGLAGTVTISLTIANQPSGADITTTFDLVVNDAGVDHNGWKNIMAMGPKIDRFKNAVENPFVCSWSPSHCDQGQPCNGTQDPQGNVLPDDVNAIYLNHNDPANPLCYYSAAEATIQDLTYMAKNGGVVVIDYTDATQSPAILNPAPPVPPVPGSEGFGFYLVNIDMDDVTRPDTDDIVSLIEGDTTTNTLLSVTNNNPGIPQDVLTEPVIVSLAPSIKIGDITYFARNNKPVTIEYKAGGTAGAESVIRTGTAIEVTIDDGVSTADQIITALEAAEGQFIRDNVIRAYNHKPGDVTALQSITAGAQAVVASTQVAWKSLQTTCSVTSSIDEPTCDGATLGEDLGASCMALGSPIADADAVDVVPSATSEENKSFYDAENKICYRNIGNNQADWREYKATGSVTLEWEQFSVSGSSAIDGFQVFRKVADNDDANNEFDYDRPLNRTMLANTTTIYVDSHLNSAFPPIPNTVYIYEVVPVINDQLTLVKGEIEKQVRVLVPGNNQVFVHRWIANQTMCNLLNSENRSDSEFTLPTKAEHFKMESYDLDKNRRCRYHGPGDTDDPLGSNISYYDLGKDLIVDRYEAACPYSIDGCDSADGQCMGTGTPTFIADINDFYYDRQGGDCYRNTAAGSNWELITGNAKSCPFSGFACDTNPNGAFEAGLETACVGSGTPNATIDGLDNAFYLDTDDGACYFNDDGGADNAWTVVGGGDEGQSAAIVRNAANAALPDVEATFKVNKYNSAHNPPLVNVSQMQANVFCSSLPGYNPSVFAANVGAEEVLGLAGVGQDIRRRLPNRKMQVVYSQWNEAVLDSQAATDEQGLSLQASSKCNSSGASGFESNFSSDLIPDVSNFFTVPGTDTSSIRSLETGSTITLSCQSKFGVQDSIGNVGEWVQDRLICDFPISNSNPNLGNGEMHNAGLSSCEALSSENQADYLELDNGAGNNQYDTYVHPAVSMLDYDDTMTAHNVTIVLGGDYEKFDYWRLGNYRNLAGVQPDANSDDINDIIMGPCLDNDSDDVCDGPIDLLEIQQEDFGATYFFVPLGLPMNGDFVTKNTTGVGSDDETLDSIFRIGSSSGIAKEKLHNDVIKFNTGHIYAERSGCGGMAAGGGFNDGSGAGMWSFEMLPCNDTNLVGYTTYENKIALKDIEPTDADIMTIEWQQNAATSHTFADPNLVILSDAGAAVSEVDLIVQEIMDNQGAGNCLNNGGTDFCTAAVMGPIDTATSRIAVTVDPETNFSTDLRGIAKSKRTDIGFRCVIEIPNNYYLENLEP